jgi:hypothetical protein
MAALVAYEDSLCQGCGQPMDATADPAATWLVEDRRCWSCWSKERVQRTHEMAAKDNTGALDGLKVWVKGRKPKP